jgi:hypothetical protein
MHCFDYQILQNQWECLIKVVDETLFHMQLVWLNYVKEFLQIEQMPNTLIHNLK